MSIATLPPPQIAEYIPTPEQIGEACDEIQAGWTDEDRSQRRRGVRVLHSHLRPPEGMIEEAYKHLAARLAIQHELALRRLQRKPR